MPTHRARDSGNRIGLISRDTVRIMHLTGHERLRSGQTTSVNSLMLRQNDDATRLQQTSLQMFEPAATNLDGGITMNRHALLCWIIKVLPGI